MIIAKNINNCKKGNRKKVKPKLAKMRGYLGNAMGTASALDEKGVERMKEQFISNTSHELRTPLASIKEAVSLVFDEIAGPINEDQRRFLEIAKRNIDRLAILIGNLLDLSKIDSGRMELEKSKVKINKIAQRVLAKFMPLAQDKRIELLAKLGKDLPWLYVDRDKISQAVVNLVSNAFKFTESGGKVIISTGLYGADKNFIAVNVQDTGVGIDKKDFVKLFQRFKQLDGSLTRRVSGAGVGLAVSQEIAGLHGGKILVESKKGRGSKFTLVLPAARQ